MDKKVNGVVGYENDAHSSNSLASISNNLVKESCDPSYVPILLVQISTRPPFSDPNMKVAMALLEKIAKDFPNGTGRWVYIHRNIQGYESNTVHEVPGEALNDEDYMEIFCFNYPYGTRCRESPENRQMTEEQIYFMIETVTPLLLDVSESRIQITNNPFCRPMPPDEIFCMVAAACPNLGSADHIKRTYYHVLTDPSKSTRVNSASILSGQEGCSASEEDWMMQLFCPMCLVFGCWEHSFGIYRKLIETDSRCSSDCYRSNADKVAKCYHCQLFNQERLFRYLSTLVQAGRWKKAAKTNKSRQGVFRILVAESPCEISKKYGIPCFSVFRFQSYLKSIRGVSLQMAEWKCQTPAKFLKGTKNYTWKKILNVVMKFQKDKVSDAEHCPYKPCFCSGKCEKNACSCALQGFCEKYCCCSDDCILRFPGCRCQTHCDTNSCPCYKANRECDVDLCLACSGFKILSVNNGCSHSELETSAEYELGKCWEARCKNMQMQKGANKRLYVTKSAVHGLGVFAAQPLKRGELVSEYTGEIVPKREADRRGIVYDHSGKSYLFTLNREQDIDATRFGNEARFINHSSNANCEAQIKLVNGTHRIGIYAIKEIETGDELFFDYKYLKENEKNYPNLV